MKKLILATSLLVALFLSSNLLAQVHVGVKGSFNMMNMNVKLNDNKVDEFKIKPAFNAGLFAEFAIADEFYLRPELLFSSKGAAYKKTEEFLLIDEKREIDSKTTLNYIELPIYFLYKGRLSSGNVMVGFGPYFAYGVGGKVKGESTTSFPGGSVTRDRDANVKFTNDAEVGDIGDDIVMGEYLAQPWKRNCFKPFDVGASIMAGYEFSSKLSASLVAQFGLTDITSKVEGNEIEKSGTKNIGFGISLGYRLF